MVKSSLVFSFRKGARPPGFLHLHSDLLLFLILEFLGQGLTPAVAHAPPVWSFHSPAYVQRASLEMEGTGFL